MNIWQINTQDINRQTGTRWAARPVTAKVCPGSTEAPAQAFQWRSGRRSRWWGSCSRGRRRGRSVLRKTSSCLRCSGPFKNLAFGGLLMFVFLLVYVSAFRVWHVAYSTLPSKMQQIDDNVSIVPRGAYIVTPSHRVLKNPAFEGKNFLRLFCDLCTQKHSVWTKFDCAVFCVNSGVNVNECFLARMNQVIVYFQKHVMFENGSTAAIDHLLTNSHM